MPFRKFYNSPAIIDDGIKSNLAPMARLLHAFELSSHLHLLADQDNSSHESPSHISGWTDEDTYDNRMQLIKMFESIELANPWGVWTLSEKAIKNIQDEGKSRIEQAIEKLYEQIKKEWKCMQS